MSNELASQAPPTSTADAAVAAERDAAVASGRTLGVTANVAIGMLVMLPWPALALLAAWSSIEQAWEWPFVFGGATMLLLVPFALVATLPEWVFGAVIAIVWIAAWLLPPFLRARRIRRARTAGTLAATRMPPSFVIWLGQSGFALVQAALGALMIVGKSI